MLQTISWKEYFITIGLGTVLYYGWWLVRYYSGWQGRGRKAAGGRVDGGSKAGAAAEEGAMGVVAEVGQTAAIAVAVTAMPVVETEPSVEQAAVLVAQQELPFPAVVVEQPVFLPVVAGNLRNDILRLMDKVGPAEVGEADLLELVRGLLETDPYPILKGTGFQEEINALIVREMDRYGSISVDPEVVRELWGM